MQRTAFRIGKFIPRTWTRAFSASRTRQNSSDSHGTKKYIENLYRHTKNPLWHLVDSLQTRADRVYPYNALHDNQVSIEDFKKWEPVLYQPDIAAALSTLKKLGYQITPSPHSANGQSDLSMSPKPIPSWIVLCLVGYRVKTVAGANGPLMDLVFSHIDSAAVDIKGPLLTLAAFQLARFNLLLPLRQVLNTFFDLDIPIHDQERQFNVFLRALSSVPLRSVENTNNIRAVLKTMDDRQLKLKQSTYNALLNERSATLFLTKSLFLRMVNEDCTPTAYQLESFLRIFANNGRADLAERFFESIHALTEGELDPEASSADPRTRANTLMLNSFNTRRKAAAFLRRLVDAIPENSPDHVHLAGNLPIPQRQAPLVHKTENDVYDQTAVFHVAAKDLSTSTSRLTKIFLSLDPKPNAVTYTILIRGLLARSQYEKAEMYWSRLAKRADLILDKEALTAGIQAYTRNGKPHKAFQLLEKYGLKPGQDPSSCEPHRPVVEITTISMNEYIVALNRIQRPDVVFRLWDHMGTLYDAFPNAATLSILLQSARLAYRMDDTLSGAIAKLGLLNPFRSFKVYKPRQSRIQAVDEIISCVGHPSRGNLRRYSSGIWKDLEPVDFARKVFLQVLFGNDPSGRFLSDIESPAGATRKSYEDDASSSIGLPDLAPKKYVFEPFPDLLTPEGKSHYPHIVVTNANCFNYITLIGVGGRANEIPLVLAWMRALGLQPSESTLAASLVFWSEISVQAPLVEKWTGGPEKNEYAKLVDWVRDWVGESRVPNDEALRKWRRIVNKMRAVPR